MWGINKMRQGDGIEGNTGKAEDDSADVFGRAENPGCWRLFREGGTAQ